MSDAGSDQSAESVGTQVDATTAQRLNAAVRADRVLYMKILRYEVRRALAVGLTRSLYISLAFSISRLSTASRRPRSKCAHGSTRKRSPSTSRIPRTALGVGIAKQSAPIGAAYFV